MGIEIISTSSELVKVAKLSLAPFEEQTIPEVLVYYDRDGVPIYVKVSEEFRNQKLALLK